MNRKGIPTTYDEALEALRGRGSRTIANNTRLHALDGGVIGLWLHATCVVRFYPDGRISLHTAGWHTVTTKDRLNRVALAHGWRVYSEKREWKIARFGRWHEAVDFEDGFTIPTREPSRVDHCTHPEQAWCDCDWCRYLRGSAAEAM